MIDTEWGTHTFGIKTICLARSK